MLAIFRLFRTVLVLGVAMTCLACSADRWRSGYASKDTPLPAGLGRLCIDLIGAPVFTTITIEGPDTVLTMEEGGCVEVKPGRYEIKVLDYKVSCERLWPTKVEEGKQSSALLRCGGWHLF